MTELEKLRDELWTWLSEPRGERVSRAIYESIDALITAAKAEQREEMLVPLNEACNLYCTWYDTGNPKMTGDGMAYELVTFIRQAIGEEPKTPASLIG